MSIRAGVRCRAIDAGILSQASDSKKPAPLGRDGLEQMELVAGARK